jgi:hypothetical protein
VLVTGDKFHPFFFEIGCHVTTTKTFEVSDFLTRANMAAGDIETMCLINELIKKS